MRPSIAFMSSGVSSKSNTWKEGRITLTSPPRSWPPPGDWRTFQLDGDKKRGQGRRVCPQLPGEQSGPLWRILTCSFHTFSYSVHLTNITVHQSLIFLSESLVTENKLKFAFSKHTALDTPDSIMNLSWRLTDCLSPTRPKGDSIQLKQCQKEAPPWKPIQESDIKHTHYL